LSTNYVTFTAMTRLAHYLFTIGISIELSNYVFKS